MAASIGPRIAAPKRPTRTAAHHPRPAHPSMTASSAAGTSAAGSPAGPASERPQSPATSAGITATDGEHAGRCARGSGCARRRPPLRRAAPMSWNPPGIAEKYRQSACRTRPAGNRGCPRRPVTTMKSGISATLRLIPGSRPTSSGGDRRTDRDPEHRPHRPARPLGGARSGTPESDSTSPAPIGPRSHGSGRCSPRKSATPASPAARVAAIRPACT